MANELKVKFIEGNESLLDQIKPLWEELNNHHLALSKDFKAYYLEMTFQKRKADLLRKSAIGRMRVDVAIAESTGENIGYCVTSLNAQGVGEIKSIFVKEAYRRRGIGAAFMRKALAWLDQMGSVEKIVEVAAGNEKAWVFYARYGFLPRKTMLKQVK